ncbi:exosome nuclease subunit, partial [Coemansia sp. RSA 486]
PMELVVQRSNATALNRYVKETYDADHGLGAGGWASLLRKWRSPFTPVQLQVFRVVHQWRDACAREEDESSRYVLPNHMLFAIADRMPTDVPQLLAACQPTPPLLRLYATDVARMVNLAKMAAEKRMKEFADIVSTAHEESVPDRPVHTRFDDDDHQKSVGEDVEMETEEANVPDVLTPAMLASAKELMAPRSALFGMLKDWKNKKNMEVSEASLKAQEIRKNLVLTVAAPVAVVSNSMVAEEKVEEKQQRVHGLDQDQKPVQPVVLSETYARYQPEAPRQIKKQKTDDLPRLSTINLDDISDSSDNNNNAGGKRGKKRDRKKTTATGGVAPDDVKPYEYDAAEDDVLGESTTQGASKKHKRKAAAASRGQQSFNPYGQIETTRELAKRPPRSRVQTKQGNKTMTFKK